MLRTLLPIAWLLVSLPAFSQTEDNLKVKLKQIQTNALKNIEVSRETSRVLIFDRYCGMVIRLFIFSNIPIIPHTNNRITTEIQNKQTPSARGFCASKKLLPGSRSFSIERNPKFSGVVS